MVSGYGIALQFNLIDNFSDKLQKANVAIAETGKSVRRAGRDVRQFQQNLVFAAEDAMAVYGTTGLSGVLRATSNNITMMAMALAPGSALASGLTVAAVGVGQLAMAWFTAGEEARKAEEKQKRAAEAANKYLSAVREYEGRVREGHRLIMRSREAASHEEHDAAVKALRDRLAEEREVMKAYALEERRRQEQSEKMQARLIKLRAQAIRNPRTAQGRLEKKKLLDEIATLEEKIELHREASAVIQDEYDDQVKHIKRLEEYEKIALERRKEFREANPIQQTVPLPPNYDENAVAIQTQKEINRLEKESLEAAEKKRREMERINRELKSAVDGSMEFAKAFQGTTDSAKKPETPREKASREAMERKRAQFMQNDRGMFGDRRRKETWNIAEEQGWKVDEKFRREAISYELNELDASNKQKAQNRERVQPSWDAYKRAIEKKRQATKEEMETAANTKRSSELLSQIADSLNRGPTIEVSVGGVLT